MTLIAAEPADKGKGQGPEKPVNRLAKEVSPYLRQHAGNPVDWYPWGPEAFTKAKKEDKLIFLSIGYSACHWCHVMERESFANKEIAKILNDHFICIKVDREERPDVDDVYMTALGVLGEPGGWPLSMFLSPDGKPIFGGTYWPPDDKETDSGTLTGFNTVLARVIDLNENKGKELREQSERIAEMTASAMARFTRTIPIGALDDTILTTATEEIHIDPVHGGIGSKARDFAGTKFPRPATTGFLLRQSLTDGGKSIREPVQKTLREMANGGIYDQIGGGFHRYSTERTWTVPHFEKMLYDNGQLLELYAEAQLAKPDPQWQRVLRETIGFLNREMRSSEGGYYSALDADTNYREGEFYVWTADELRKALPDRAERELATQVYGLGVPNFEEKFMIPTRRVPLEEVAERLKQEPSEVAKSLEAARQKLFDYRAKRERPFLDTKILTGWNGLTIAGLAKAGMALNDDKPIRDAAKAADFILENLRDKDGQLLRVYFKEADQEATVKGPAFLEDYAYLGHGLLNLFEATRNPKWLNEARAVTDQMIERFRDQERGGFYTTAHDSEKLFARGMDSSDGAVPSGNGTAARNLVRLAKATGDPKYQQAAEKVVRHFTATLRTNPGSAPLLTDALGTLLQQPGGLAEETPDKPVEKPSRPKQSADVVKLVTKRNGQLIDIDLTIDAPWYIYANPVGSADLRASQTVVKVTVGDDPVEAEVTYPDGERVTDVLTGPYAVYKKSAKIGVKLPAETTADAAVKIRIQLVACQEGRCLLPSTLTAEVK